MSQNIKIDHCIWIKNKNKNTVLYSNKEPKLGATFHDVKRKKQTPAEKTTDKNDNPALTDLRVCPSLAQGMSPSCCNLSHVTCTPTKNNNYNANISWISGLYQAPVVQKEDNTLD